METKGWNNANKGNHINSCRGKKFDSGDLVRLVTGDSGMILIHTCGKPQSWDTWVHEEYLVSDWQHENYREVCTASRQSRGHLASHVVMFLHCKSCHARQYHLNLSGNLLGYLLIGPGPPNIAVIITL